MSFSTWATAFVDDVSTITAAFLNQIRVDVGRAVDGTGGGAYTPSATIDLNGSGVRIGTDGGNGLGTCRRTGKMTLAGGSARTVRRQDTTTITGTADVTIDLSLGDTFLAGTPTAQRVIQLRFSNAENGERLRVIRPASGAFDYVLKREGSAAAVVTMAASTHCSAEMELIGGVWRLVMYTAGCTVGSEA